MLKKYINPTKAKLNYPQHHSSNLLNAAAIKILIPLTQKPSATIDVHFETSMQIPSVTCRLSQALHYQRTDCGHWNQAFTKCLPSVYQVFTKLTMTELMAPFHNSPRRCISRGHQRQAVGGFARNQEVLLPSQDRLSTNVDITINKRISFSALWVFISDLGDLTGSGRPLWQLGHYAAIFSC